MQQDDGRIALGAAAPLGVLQARVAEYLAAVDAPDGHHAVAFGARLRPRRGVADAALRVLAPMGLVFDENSPWLSVSACTGSPGCEHSAADVRADATAALDDPADVHRHFVGCERACGSPPVGEVLIATGDGYRRAIARSADAHGHGFRNRPRCTIGGSGGGYCPGITTRMLRRRTA